MKRINTTKLMALLASLCLITSSFVGSTLAKYTTSADAKDTARVAQFGVVIQADGNLYGPDYISDKIATNGEDETTLEVQSNNGKDVVAPGTENDKGLSFAINGTPEVATKLTATIKAENIYLKNGTYAVMVMAPTVSADSFAPDTYYTKNAANEYELATAYTAGKSYYTMQNEVTTGDYYPVVYKSSDTSAPAGSFNADSLDSIAAYYASKLNGAPVSASTTDATNTYTFSKVYDPNFEYTSLTVEGESLTWAWEFDQGMDPQDTILGNLMAGTLTNAEVVKINGTTIKAPEKITDYNLNTSFDISFTVEQIER